MRKDIILREAAWNFILAWGIDTLPVNSRAIAVRYGCRLYTYAQFSERIGKPVSYIIAYYNEEGFIFWDSRVQCYNICYNTRYPDYILRWTIMHELAHAVLGHVAPGRPVLTRQRRIEHPDFEADADGFTRRVLCPSIVLHDCKAVEPHEIMRLCGISETAAKHRSEYIKVLERRGAYRTDPLETAVERQFMPFIWRYTQGKYDAEIAIELAA